MKFTISVGKSAVMSENARVVRHQRMFVVSTSIKKATVNRNKPSTSTFKDEISSSNQNVAIPLSYRLQHLFSKNIVKTVKSVRCNLQIRTREILQRFNFKSRNG